MQKKQLLHKKPGYFRGQLLLEDDFIAEQRYHANARYRHALNLHGWGVVRGLDVTRVDETTLVVSAGFAIDGHGHEIALLQEEKLSLTSAPTEAQVAVSLIYEEEDSANLGGDNQQHALHCYAVLSAAVGVAEGAVILATVQLDEKGHIGHHAISFANRRQLKTLLLPGSVNATALDAQLRTGWLRSPFRPMPLPPDKQTPPPPFRVGPTEARSHREYDEQPNTRGAAGTMAITLPPGVTRVLRLRLAGAENEAPMHVELVIGGWDAAARKHIARNVLKADLSTGAFDSTWEIEKGDLHLETSTLALEIHAEGYARVSLVAVEVTYEHVTGRPPAQDA